MANVKIGDLPAVTSLNSADIIPTVDIGANPVTPTTYKITVKNLANSLTKVTSSINADLATSASYVTGSVHNSANPALSASYALTASYLAGVFPFVGTAIISGALRVTGSAGFTGSVNVIGGGFTGSLLGTASFTTGSIFIAGNFALTASNAISASSAITASFAATASSVYDLNQNLTITGSLLISGSSPIELKVFGDSVITGSLVVSGANGAGIFSQGATIFDYASGLTSTGSYTVWRAPFSCSVVAIYGYYEGGTTPQVNARRSGTGGTVLITGSNIRVTNSSSWIPATASLLQNTGFVAGDSLQVIMSGSTNNMLAVQVDFIRRF